MTACDALWMDDHILMDSALGQYVSEPAAGRLERPSQRRGNSLRLVFWATNNPSVPVAFRAAGGLRNFASLRLLSLNWRSARNRDDHRVSAHDRSATNTVLR